ncbi:fumarylacetoacetate hydrolase family protein, partial [Francisella tularensis]|uniref:fumarylacetoacetate hydrolase family protein n=1 Tax=Francisella tularensis TaxID=263 RepID=UPI002381A25E
AFFKFKAYKNDNLIQQGSYDEMIYKPQQIIEYLQQNEISRCENDLLMPGTPKGVGVENTGDKFKIELVWGDQ